MLYDGMAQVDSWVGDPCVYVAWGHAAALIAGTLKHVGFYDLVQSCNVGGERLFLLFSKAVFLVEVATEVLRGNIDHHGLNMGVLGIIDCCQQRLLFEQFEVRALGIAELQKVEHAVEFEIHNLHYILQLLHGYVLHQRQLFEAFVEGFEQAVLPDGFGRQQRSQACFHMVHQPEVLS